ncbi:MAG: T9SS type A sorting domain-containing protein [Gemmatimonadetes bacterium]|nr:T9SS type A sorting domain-containing protein [Gemmatimonadota bacterium]
MRYRRLLACALFIIFALSSTPTLAQHSVARQWNEALLETIGSDHAYPSVQARNLFHTSIALYDAWAVYGDGPEQPYLLGQTVGGFAVPFAGVPRPDDIEEARRQAMSYAAYHLIKHRFANSPGSESIFSPIEVLMADLGYDPAFTSTDYADGNPAALGNYIAQSLVQFGLQDGSRNRFYTPMNPSLDPAQPGHNGLTDPNFWQPLSLEKYNSFLTPEWGSVVPFALGEEAMTMYQRDGNNYPVYHDPGPPPHIQQNRHSSDLAALFRAFSNIERHRTRTGMRMASEEYQWGFALVALWSSHLDPADGVLWDISPGAIGNAPELPQTFAEYQAFYNMLDGGDASQGRPLNPHTGQPYEEQWVPRADYARVLAEFWADGPSTETPPGHWFTILNYVSDHPLFEKRFKGEGPILDDLEWDVKAYFALGGTMHDAAVTAWSIKGWYDYPRPISAIRWMGGRGQCSDSDLPSYDPAGIMLIDGYIELVQAGDPLAGEEGEHIGKVKLKAWRGPTYIADPATDIAGVGWILAENWWPYQRSNFVSPPFAGYVSGHSTFSTAAAEVLTLLTGDPFFPGGLGEFRIERNSFLVFEEGPSVDVVLQWATYRDASDQSSLSRMWGGIHPPADDIPARVIGTRIGADAFALAEAYFSSPTNYAGQGAARRSAAELPMEFALEQNYPNPFNSGTAIAFDLPYGEMVDLTVYTISGQKVATLVHGTRAAGYHQVFWNGRDEDGAELASGVYLYHLQVGNQLKTRKMLLLR